MNNAGSAMAFDNYNDYDATGLAALVRSGEISAAEVIDAAIERIESANPQLNAVVAHAFEQARTACRQALPEGPLRGVPYLVKDLNTWVGGLPATNGARALRSFVPASDSELIRRIRAAGLVILGKTNTPEFGMNICTSPMLFGATRNPHDVAYSAGGSSGGSACAVAAGMLPAAHATDSGGSIRIPASNCGLFGLKPSRARVPLGHDQCEGLAAMSTAHAVTHSVRDSALLLDVTMGAMPGDAYTAPAAPGSFTHALAGETSPLRIALCTAGHAGETIDLECKEAAIAAARHCESLGHRVEPARPGFDAHALRNAFDVIFSSNMRLIVEQLRRRNGTTDIEQLFEPATIAASEHARRFAGSDYAAAIACMQQTARTMGYFFERYDVLLTPTLAHPPLPLDVLTTHTSDWPDFLCRLLDEIPFTPLFNATGAPAASLPLATSRSGLPIGVHIGAALGNETVLLQLAAQLEQLAPWHDRH